MKINKYKWMLLFVGALFIACDSDDDSISTDDEQIIVVSGEADFSKYVSVGNSLTAGFTDGALFIAGQENSMASILAQQFALAGGGEFTQPIMGDNLGGLTLGGNIIAPNRLFFNGSAPERVPGAPSTEITSTLSGPFNNMGVPLAKSFHIIAPGYGNVAGVPIGQANPFYVRFASSPNATILNDAVSQQPTFFSLWVGNNDVLSYAISGGDGVNQAGNFDPSTYGSNDITDPNVFAQVYSGIVDAMTAGGAKGVVANIPNVTSIPYFTTVPHNPLSSDNPNFGPLIPTLNQTFAGLNQVFVALGVPERQIVFNPNGQSAVVIKDENLQNLSAQIAGALIAGGADPLTAQLFAGLYGQARQATAQDLLVLPSSSIIGQLNQEAFDDLVNLGVPPATAGQLAVNGVTFPLEDQWVLTPEEQQDVITATAAFNQIIESVANQKGLAFVDSFALLNEVAETGIAFDEFTLNANLVFGGAFSLDGVHPTARGYAFLANEFMKAINAKYGSTLPPVKARDYITLYPASM